MNFKKAIVIKIEEESSDSKSIYLKIKDNFDIFYPGQFCYLKLNNDNNMIRPYSIVNNYEDFIKTQIIQFTVKKMLNGYTSKYINDELKINEEIEISSPKGNLSIKNKNIRNILFIAGGSGITMIKSFINHFSILNKQKVFLLYGVKFSNQIIFKSYFENLKNNFFDYKIFISDEKNDKYNNGYISKEDIKSIINEYDSVFLVGPEAMINKMETYLKDLNFLGNIYIE